MKAYRIDRFGSVDGIVLRSSDDPRPGLREILMRVRASSLNYRDLMVLKGGGRGPTKLGVIPLSDGAGEVAAIGDGRDTGQDRRPGCRLLSSALVWRTDQARIPDRPARRQSRRDAGGIRGVERGGAGARAEPPLLRGSRDLAMRCGDRLGRSDRPSPGYRRRYGLTQGSGGVSVFALQFARLLGARVIATTSTAGEGRAAQGAGCLRGDQLHRDARLGREGARADRWPRRRLRGRDRRAGNDRDVAEGLGRGRTCQPDRREPVAVGDGARSFIADRPRHHTRLDQRRQPHRF